jgi:hypothetical protein
MTVDRCFLIVVLILWTWIRAQAVLNITEHPEYLPSDLPLFIQAANDGDSLKTLPNDPGLVIPLRMSTVVPAPLLSTLKADQLALDMLTLCLIGWIAYELAGRIGLYVGTLIYATSIDIAAASALPYYYFWPIPFSVVTVALLLLLKRCPKYGLPIAVVLGLNLGLAVWLRSTQAVMLMTVPLLIWGFSSLRHAIAILAVALMVLAPAHGLPRHQIWHDLYIGIGQHANPYGILHNDASAADLAASHGIGFKSAGYEPFLRGEYLRIVRDRPFMILRNWGLNIMDALLMKGVGRFPFEGMHLLFPAAAVGWLVSRDSWLGALLVLWISQVIAVSFVKDMQGAYLWETLGLAVLCGAVGASHISRWCIKKGNM